MYTSKKPVLLLLLMLTSLAWSCKTAQPIASSKGKNKIAGESFVLANTTTSNFLFTSIVKGSVRVRSTYLSSDLGAMMYQEGTDYTIDYKNGTIARTVNSRIPNYANHPLFEKSFFDQNNYSNYSNMPYFVWVDYATKKKDAIVETTVQGQYLSAFKISYCVEPL